MTGVDVPSRRDRRIMTVIARWLFVSFAGSLCALSLAVLLLLGTQSGKDIVLRWALVTARQTVPGIRIGRLQGSIFRGIVLRKIELRDRDGKPAIELERLYLRLSLRDLLSRRVVIERIDIDTPTVFYCEDSQGTSNLENIVVSSPSDDEDTPSEPWRVRINALQLNNASMYRCDAKSSRASALFEELFLKASGLYSERHQQLHIDDLHGRFALKKGEPMLIVHLDTDVQRRVDRVSSRVNLRTEFPTRKWISSTLSIAGKLEKLLVNHRLEFPDGGSVTLKGVLQLSEALSLEGYRLSVSLGKVNPRAIWPSLPAGDLNLNVAAHGRGIPYVDRYRHQLRVQLSRSRLLRIPIRQLSLRTSMLGKRLRISHFETDTAGVRLAAKGTLSPRDFDLSASVSAARLDRLNAPQLPPSLTQVKGMLWGNLHASGPWDRFTLDAQIKAKALRIDTLKVSSLSAKAALSELPHQLKGHATIYARSITERSNRLQLRQVRLISTGSGQKAKVSLKVAGSPFGGVFRGHIEQREGDTTVRMSRLKASFRKHHLRLVAPSVIEFDRKNSITVSPVRARLSGGKLLLWGSLKTRGRDALGNAHVELERVRLNRALFVSTATDLKLGPRHLTARARGAILRSTKHDRDRATFRLNAAVPLSQPDFALDTAKPLALDLDLLNVPVAVANGFSTPAPRLSGYLSAHASAHGPLDTADVKLSLSGRQIRLGRGAPFDAKLRTELSASDCRLDAESSLAGRRWLSVAAKTDRSLSQLLHKPPKNLSDIAQTPLRGQLDIQKTKIKQLLALYPDAFVEFTDIKGSLVGSSRLILSPTQQSRSELKMHLSGLHIADRSIGNLDLRFQARRDRLQHLRSMMSLTWNGAKMVHAKVNTRWPTHLTSTDRFTDQRVNGSVRVQVPQLAVLRSLHPSFEHVSGKGEAEGHISGAMVNPASRIHARLSQLKIAGIDVGKINAYGQLKNKRWAARLSFFQKDGGRFALKSRGNVQRYASLYGTVNARRLSISFLPQLFPALESAHGRLFLNARASGITSRPTVQGSLVLKHGRFRMRGAGEIKDVYTRVSVRKKQLILHKLKLRSKHGVIKSHGTYRFNSLSTGTFRIQTQAKKFDINYGHITGGQFSGHMTTTGKVSRSGVETSLKLRNAVIKLPEIGDEASLHRSSLPTDIVFVESFDRSNAKNVKKISLVRGGSSPNLAVFLDAKPVFVRSDDVDVELASRIRLRRHRADKQQLTGFVSVKSGWVKLFDHRFRVRKATVRFNKKAPTNPALHIFLTRKIADVTLSIALMGTVQSPELVLTSTPAIYDQSQLISMVLTGRADLRRDKERSDSTLTIASAVSQLFIGRLAKQLIPHVGLDVAKVKIGQTADAQTGQQRIRAEAEVGKYLTNRLYVAYRRVFGASVAENTNEAAMEYRLSAHWLLMAVFGDAAIGGVDLLWSHQY